MTNRAMVFWSGATFFVVIGALLVAVGPGGFLVSNRGEGPAPTGRTLEFGVGMLFLGQGLLMIVVAHLIPSRVWRREVKPKSEAERVAQVAKALGYTLIGLGVVTIIFQGVPTRGAFVAMDRDFSWIMGFLLMILGVTAVLGTRYLGPQPPT